MHLRETLMPLREAFPEGNTEAHLAWRLESNLGHIDQSCIDRDLIIDCSLERCSTVDE